MKAAPTLSHWGGLISMDMEDLAKRYTNEYSKFVKVNGYNIHYQDRGQGNTIILMHGIFSSLQTWDAWKDELSKTHRVIALDMPGFGLTGGPPKLDDFDEEHAPATFEKFVNKLNLRSVSLAGNSLGGYIAARYAAQNPGRVDMLILLDPFGYPQDTPWILSLGTFPPVAFVGNYIQPAWMVALNVSWIYGDSSRVREEDYMHYVHMNLRPGAKPQYVITLKMIEARVPLELADKWMADIPKARLIVYPTAGHIPMEELPEQTTRDALLFLRGDLHLTWK
ncbi:alpha/beta fold hydrolase [Marinobacter sp. DY40_1A1]|uniref:alpha/beta fold hydrolase n=2 Tax=Marinobacteraceae TaxID=2887365 RepID=UPI00190477C9|nr:alpha/beta hydrolase [Marinobacter sp. DY40_1A1]MBK1885654.1 alpha/beta hydrolase [Marinobacter sp. DY40_1A1]